MRDTASQDQLELARDDPEERTEYQEPDEPELDEPEVPLLEPEVPLLEPGAAEALPRRSPSKLDLSRFVSQRGSFGPSRRCRIEH